MTLIALPPWELVSKASSISFCENPNLWVMSGSTLIFPVLRKSMQSGHVFLYRKMPIISTSLPEKTHQECHQQHNSIQKKNPMYRGNYFAETTVRGTVISLQANPIRQTLPPEREAFRAVDIVLLVPTQSKITSTWAPIAVCICTTSWSISCNSGFSLLYQSSK